MIAYMKGEITEIEEEWIVVENDSVGYRIFVPLSLSRKVNLSDRVKIYTYLNVKEDSLTLYGFLTKEELTLFKLMLGVSGIGPKGAMGILTMLSPDNLRFAVMSEDAKAIAKAPGIGTKTAMKLIIELKDKLKIEDIFPSTNLKDEDKEEIREKNRLKGEALQALTALGYSQSEAVKAIKNVEISEDTKTAEIVKAALKNIMTWT